MKMNKTRSSLSSPETGIGTVRERTLTHMESLLRRATTVGAGIVLACGAKAQSPRPPQVVDPPPPPPPACCEDPEHLLLRGCLNQQNHWVKSGMRWTLQLSLSAHSGPTHVTFLGLKREDVKIAGVSIKRMNVEFWGVDFVLTAGASSRQATLQFPVLCNDKKVTLKLILDLSKAPVENGSVPVKLVK